MDPGVNLPVKERNKYKVEHETRIISIVTMRRRDYLNLQLKGIPNVIIPLIDSPIKQCLKSDCPIPLKDRPVNLWFDIPMFTEPPMLNGPIQRWL
jgi:hypothetical protein